MIKPFTPRQVIGILEKAMELQGRQIKIFSYKTGKVENRIPFKDIMYFSSETKRLLFIREMEKILFMENCQN